MLLPSTTGINLVFFLFEVLLLKSEYVRGREKSLLGRALLYGLVRLWPCGLQHVQAFACSFSSDQRKRCGRLAPDASQVRIPPLIAPNSYPAVARESSSLCRLLAGARRGGDHVPSPIRFGLPSEPLHTRRSAVEEDHHGSPRTLQSDTFVLVVCSIFWLSFN